MRGWRAALQVAPSGRVWAALAAIGLVLIGGVVAPALTWLGLGLDALLLGLFALDGVLAHRHRVTVDRELPSTLYQGQAGALALHVHNHERRPARLRVRDGLAPELTHGPLTFDLLVAARQRGTHRAEVTPINRGAAALDPVAVRVLGPLGLAWAGREVAADQTARVLPRIRLEGRSGLMVQHLVERRSGESLRNRAGVSTEVHGLRDYVAGDEFRTIDWKATARRQRPVTREHAWSQHQSVVILLDCGRPMATRAQVGQPASARSTWSKLDHALEASLHLMRVVHAQGDHATLVLFSKTVRTAVSVDRRTTSIRQLFERLHAEQPDDDEPDYGRAAAWVGRRIPRQSLVLVVTSVVDLVRAEVLAGTLAGLARRHWPVLVDLEDPGLLALARSIPEAPLGAFAKVSAMSLQESNRHLSARLQAHGVQHLPVSADELTVGLVQRYLDLKRRG